ncbi:hypothetical protein OF83DRAFT_843860 [Amylostereum chailletii]|nr:hypothetical protein OF83DRAFT_843860 [Amylostereum chailletii]
MQQAPIPSPPQGSVPRWSKTVKSDLPPLCYSCSPMIHRVQVTRGTEHHRNVEEIARVRGVLEGLVDHRNRLAPISRLLPELLSYIFNLSVFNVERFEELWDLAASNARYARVYDGTAR